MIVVFKKLKNIRNLMKINIYCVYSILFITNTNQIKCA